MKYLILLLLFCTEAFAGSALPFQEKKINAVDGVLLDVRSTRHFGVQAIEISGWRVGIDVYMIVFYNMYTHDFYTDVLPRDLGAPNQRDMPYYYADRKFVKREETIENFKTIDLYWGNPFAQITHVVQLIVNLNSQEIIGGSFETSDARNIARILRPFKRKPTEAAKVRTDECRLFLRTQKRKNLEF